MRGGDEWTRSSGTPNVRSDENGRFGRNVISLEAVIRGQHHRLCCPCTYMNAGTMETRFTVSSQAVPQTYSDRITYDVSHIILHYVSSAPRDIVGVVYPAD